MALYYAVGAGAGAEVVWYSRYSLVLLISYALVSFSTRSLVAYPLVSRDWVRLQKNR